MNRSVVMVTVQVALTSVDYGFESHRSHDR